MQNNQKTIIGGGVLIVVILLITGVLLTQQSLPGDALYSFKTNFVEQGTESLQFSSKNKANYQISRMKSRLHEVQTLSKKETVSTEAVTALQTAIQNHSTTLSSIVEKSIDSAFPKTDILYTLNEFASIAGAIETISESNTQLSTLGDSTEDVRRETTNLFKSRAQSYVQTETPQTALEYIKTQLILVKTELEDQSLTEETVKSAENYLDRVGDAFSKNDLTKALVSIGESYRILKIEKYAGDFFPAPVEPAPKTASTTELLGTTSIKIGTTSAVIPLQ